MYATYHSRTFPADEHGERFEVLHLSAPDIHELRGITDVRDAV